MATYQAFSPQELNNILGFDEKIFTVEVDEPTIHAERLINLYGSMPQELFVHSDIFEPYIAGDVYAPLLTKVNIDFSKLDYWDMQSKAISTPRYLPILLTGFRTFLIDLIDIRALATQTHSNIQR